MRVANKNFDEAFKYTIGNEGSYSNDKNDSGGPTKFGITIYDLSRYLKRPASVQEVKDMSLETAKTIYKPNYWDSMGLDHMLSPGMSICMFDIGVVRGIGVPPKYAQNICNQHGFNLSVDGHLGPLSYGALNQISSSVFIRDFSSMAESGFRAIAARNPSQNVFLKGWLNRAHRLLSLIPRG